LAPIPNNEKENKYSQIFTCFMQRLKFISVDMQYDFTREGGVCFAPRPSVSFIQDELIPFFLKNNIRVHEIISDYRQERPGDPRDCCRPGEWGYTSEIPKDLLKSQPWIKSQNSPAWIRDNIGYAEKEPGLPFQDGDAFSNWLIENIGAPEETDVCLFGLALDRCVLSTAMELRFRGYQVYVLEEATDTSSGSHDEKEYLLSNPPLIHWAVAISFSEIKERLSSD